jgi:hypothetical protein
MSLRAVSNPFCLFVCQQTKKTMFFFVFKNTKGKSSKCALCNFMSSNCTAAITINSLKPTGDFCIFVVFFFSVNDPKQKKKKKKNKEKKKEAGKVETKTNRQNLLHLLLLTQLVLFAQKEATAIT